ncbi:MAG: transposase, partial [Terrimicrobiaceae bacterium]
MRGSSIIKTQSFKTSGLDAQRPKRFSREFPQEAVRILEAGRNRAQLSRELGVSTWSLTRWKKLFGEGGAGVGSVGKLGVGSQILTQGEACVSA